MVYAMSRPIAEARISEEVQTEMALDPATAANFIGSFLRRYKVPIVQALENG